MKGLYKRGFQAFILLLVLAITLTGCVVLNPKPQGSSTNSSIEEAKALDPDMVLESGMTMEAAKLEMERAKVYLDTYFDHGVTTRDLRRKIVRRFVEELGTSPEELDMVAADGVVETATEKVNESLSSERDLYNRIHSLMIEENIDRWFGGQKLKRYVGNNRNYNWYIDQNTTGKYGYINCMPSCAVMALKWADGDFNETVREARNKFLIGGEGWYPSDAEKYFDSHGLKYSRLNFNVNSIDKGIEDLKSVIDGGGIAIICVRMKYLARAKELWYHIDNPEDQSWRDNEAHAMIVKGYMEMDDNLYFEIYDPDGGGEVYNDTEMLLDIDRFYNAGPLIKSVYKWWNRAYALVVYEQ